MARPDFSRAIPALNDHLLPFDQHDRGRDSRSS